MQILDDDDIMFFPRAVPRHDDEPRMPSPIIFFDDYFATTRHLYRRQDYRSVMKVIFLLRANFSDFFSASRYELPPLLFPLRIWCAR